MTYHQKIFAVIVGVSIFVMILRLVQKKRLNEEYAWLWLVTGAGIVVLVLWYDLLVFFAHLIGAVLPTTALFIFSLLFLMLITLQFSIKISKLSFQMKKLAQEVAILRSENQDLKSDQTSKNNAPDS